MTTFPYFTVTGKIHEGSDTILHQGYRNSDHAPVAIKVSRSEYPSRRELGKLRHEYAILTTLNVRGVVKAFSLEKYGAGLALVLEELRGQAVSELIRTQKLDLSTVLRIGSSLAEIFSEIHKQDCTHKDVKPHNILFEPATKKVHLIDFGIATLLSQESQRATSPEALEGSLAYMSPEQTGRMNRVIDYRTDFYSLGVTLYEMLVGELPFPTEDPSELVHSHIARMPVPPHQRHAELPEVVSDIVMKLMAKTAEDRYQSGHGLKVDLDECLHQWETTGRIAKFPLGRQDRSDKLSIPQRLYGRTEELSALSAAFGRVGQGNAELVLMTGPSGIGKTSLVNEIYKSPAFERGFLVSGKFEPLSRSAPYRPIAQAFRDLLHLILSERAESLHRWREKLTAALDSNGRLICELIPELELVIGAQPPVVLVGPTEAENRFHLVFQNFVRAFCSAERPLALFLDDLQFADYASLKLLQMLTTDPERHHLLIIGAYRDNEVTVGHPWATILDELRKSSAIISTLPLRPLELAHISALVSDCLSSSPQHTAPLAQLVMDKTHGNPFFVGQFLTLLHNDGLLHMDGRSRAWTWDNKRIQELSVTANVVPFMLEKIQRLAPATQRVLELAACIGHQFDLATLSLLSEQAPEKAAADLWEALRESLVIPVSPEYRFTQGSTGTSGMATATIGSNIGSGPISETDWDAAPEIRVSYRFVHDRVRQAAYSLIKEEQRRQTHLAIGRRLLRKHGEQEREEVIFDVVNHLNLGAELITDRKERLQLAQYNLTAGLKAKGASAYPAAAEYFASGMAMLDPQSWESEYQLAFSIYVERLECEYLTGNVDQAEHLFGELIKHVRTDFDRAHIYNLRIMLHAILGKFAEALAAARTGLVLLGLTLPEDEQAIKAAFGQELLAVPVGLAGRRIDDLTESPVMDDETQRAAMRLLMSAFLPSYIACPPLSLLIAVKQVNLSLRYGNSDISAYGYATYGMILAAVFGRYRDAFEFGTLALKLNDKFGNASLQCKLANIYGGFIHFFCRPLRDGLPYFEKGNQAGMVSGDFTYLSFNCFQIISTRLSLGDDLAAVNEDIDRFLILMQRTREPLSTAYLTIACQLVANLQGRTRDRLSFSDDKFDENKYRDFLLKSSFLVALYQYYQEQLLVRFLFEDYQGAWESAVEAERYAVFSSGSYIWTEAVFYSCLAITALYPSLAEADREPMMAKLESYQSRLADWADTGPDNFRHKLLLVSAEMARINDQKLEAMELYDQAIEQARHSDFIPNEALANELAAKFYLSQGRQAIAGLYFGRAYYGYQRWGATSKANQLMEQHGALIPQNMLAPQGGGSTTGTTTTTGPGSSTTTSSRMVAASVMDVTAVLRAAQAIASELVLDRVLEQLMRSVLTNAGAQRGFLILKREERLFVEASISINPDEVQVGLHIPLSSHPEIARSVAQYVLHTREGVVLGDAPHDKRFGNDPQIVARRPKSILCLALVHQGRVTGILYLENNLANHAFTTDRIELLQLLSSQAAIAVENSLLYTHVQSVTEQLRLSNEDLMQANTRLQQAAVQVRSTNQDLAKVNEQLKTELKERAHAEEQRAALQEEIIRVQGARLAEMSTPLIPITDRIMVMPLIGTMDQQRAQQVLDTALHGAQSNRAKVVIIDITGMKHVDTSVASALISAAAALRLLGTQAVLTGIRAEVAQTLVSLGIDLGSIVTRANLQSGIAYAVTAAGTPLAKQS